MSNLNNNVITSTTLLSNSNLVYTTVPNGQWDTSISLSTDMTDFFELVLAALGYDITYSDFKNMSKDQRKQLIRDIKLKTIL